jgi:hypothetical protein
MIISGIPTRRASEDCCPPVTGSARLILLAVLTLAGCRTQPYVNAHIESVNAEYRQLEDYVYALEAENALLHQEMEGLRTVTPTTRPGTSEPARGGQFRRPGAAPSRLAPSDPQMEPPVIELPGESPSMPPPGSRSRLQRPETEPADTPPSIEFPRRSNAPVEETLPLPPVPQGPGAPEQIRAQPADRTITHLFLNPLQTGGIDLDSQPGDDGLRVVIEPRNASGELVREAGAISIVVLDPDRQGEAARVARWDFDSSAGRQLLAASTPGRGLKVEVPWPAAPPATNRLKLFVRFETEDGRKLQADREIFLTPHSEAIGRWTPRSADRQASTTEPIAEVQASQGRPDWTPHR